MYDYSMLPEHMQSAARRYIEEGELPGHFLFAVLSNNLMEAASRADDVNQVSLHTWASWMYNEIPGSAHGSREEVLMYATKVRAARKVEREDVEKEVAQDLEARGEGEANG